MKYYQLKIHEKNPHPHVLQHSVLQVLHVPQQLLYEPKAAGTADNKETTTNTILICFIDLYLSSYFNFCQIIEIKNYKKISIIKCVHYNKIKKSGLSGKKPTLLTIFYLCIKNMLIINSLSVIFCQNRTHLILTPTVTAKLNVIIYQTKSSISHR